MGQDKGDRSGNDGSSGETVGKRLRARSTSPTPKEVNKAQSWTVRDCSYHMICTQAECTHSIWRVLNNPDIYNKSILNFINGSHDFVVLTRDV